MPTLLADLPDGVHAMVSQVRANGSELDEHHLRRLCELGFLPGEPVLVLHRGPGGREPLAVAVGDTMFALRLLEARCITVELVEPPQGQHGHHGHHGHGQRGGARQRGHRDDTAPPSTHAALAP